MNPYSGAKVLFHGKRLEALRAGEQPNPLHVQIILSDLCNHDCSFCAYRMSGYTSNQLFNVIREDGTQNHNPNRMITTAKAHEILDDCERMGVRAIQFTGGGEPTVHPDHIEIFGRALDLGMRCALVTNGNRLQPGWEDVLPFFSWLRVSLDAGTPETYASVRRVKPTAFHKALANIQAIRTQIDAQMTAAVLGVGFVVTRENWSELYEAVRLAKENGAHNVRIGAMFSQMGATYYDGMIEPIRELEMRAKELQGDGFLVFDLFGQRVDDLFQGAPDYQFCGFEHFTTYIGADLNVYRCCNTAYNERGLIGSLKDQTFDALWQSYEKRKAFAEFDARGCERCQFNHINRTILAAVNPPVHVDFV